MSADQMGSQSNQGIVQNTISFKLDLISRFFLGRRAGLKMDFPQANNATPFNFRPLSSSQQNAEKLGTSSAPIRPKMSLPVATKNKEVPVLK